MAEKKVYLNSPFSPNGIVHPGQKNFDKDYLSIKIVDKVVKTGSGEDDFIVMKKVIVEKQPIEKVVQADAESVGVYNIINQVLKTGDTSLLPVDKGFGAIADYVGAPSNLMELDHMGKEAAKKFGALPKELTGDLDMVTFVNTMTQEKFDAFIKAIADRQAQGQRKDVDKPHE